MGTQFEIVDKRNGRRFDMDKLYVAGLDAGAALTQEEVLAAYNEAAAQRYGATDPKGNDYTEIARRIWAFCNVAGWEIEWWNDMGRFDEPQYDAWRDYPLVDGRCGGPFDPDPCAERSAALLNEPSAKHTPPETSSGPPA